MVRAIRFGKLETWCPDAIARELRLSLKTFFKGSECEKGLVATSRLSFGYTWPREGISLRRGYQHSTRRSPVHAVFTGSHTVTAVRIKAYTLLGTRCCGERLQKWCRGRYRKFNPAWSRTIPGFGSSGTRSRSE